MPGVFFVALSTRGAIVHSPQRRSSPNQLTVNAADPRLGQVRWRSSSDTYQSLLRASMWVFSGAVSPSSTLRVTARVS